MTRRVPIVVSGDEAIIMIAGCQPPDSACTDCHDCVNPTPACGPGGTCGPCNTDKDCCPPLVCTPNGTCVLPPPQIERFS
ncbi:hypothetical protein [Polyangium jinanense]|uniref:Uncharacterized protein n=1 Tax=Polyangium jinanense TaxID=2829994 RepID=A0A9X4AWS6_9BACT|nr:hypothetical protein [Polyangium jinanense]MDC3959161.1 hypothetical protein [Polyangium jinanense]MDC3987619.1 hypothetical protein [Polyangium jinanense]